MNVSMFGDVCSYMVPMGPVALADFHELPRRTPLRTAPAFMPSSFMAPAAPPQQGRMSAKSVKSRPSCKSTRRVVAQIPGEASPWWSTMSHQRGPADAPRVKVGQCVLVSA
ncbi:unnamed protein product [Prorocentrum cordatum]|uniref:Uncharacterized protein n=1 Tax=Prorocentrum cordatum TaxID=2364126 RepID=A0ABN9VSF8_9DINO|nr:unnamed protein product [Polarella glacialis]